MNIVLKNYSGLLQATTCSGSRKLVREFNRNGIDLIEGACELNQRAYGTDPRGGLQEEEVPAGAVRVKTVGDCWPVYGEPSSGQPVKDTSAAGVEGASDLLQTLE